MIFLRKILFARKAVIYNKNVMAAVVTTKNASVLLPRALRPQLLKFVNKVGANASKTANCTISATNGLAKKALA
jgi:hypothetical protein